MKKGFIKRYFSFAFNKERFGSLNVISILTASLSVFGFAKSKPSEYGFSLFGGSWFNTVFLSILFFFLSYIFISFFFFLLKEKILQNIKDRFLDKYGYGLGLLALKDALHLVNHYNNLNQKALLEGKKLLLEDDKALLTNYCTYLKDYFEKRSGLKCCVTIHVFPYVTKGKALINSRVVNFVRDRESEAHRNKDENYMTTDHNVFLNTCYEEIVRNLLTETWDKLDYINNDLPKDIKYQSTSIEAKRKSGIFFDQDKIENIKHRRLKWFLPYQSEIVVPILPSKNQTEAYLLGFLCVDCNSKKQIVFRKKYDVELLQIFVDGIYHIMLRNCKIDL